MERLEAIQERLDAITAETEQVRDEAVELETRDDRDTDAEQANLDQFEALSAEFDTLNEERGKIVTRNERLAEMRTAVAAGNVERGSGPEGIPKPSVRIDDVFDPDSYRTETRSGMRSRAVTAIEEIPDVPDDVRAAAVAKVEASRGISNGVTDTDGLLSRYVLATCSNDYRSAFVKYCAGMAATFTHEEARAVAVASEMRTALGLTQSAYVAPAIVDPAVILTSAGVTNPFRQVSRVETITANSWKPVTSGGISASYDAELAEVSDDTPTMAQPEITCYTARAFAQGSIEAIGDWAGLGNELAREFADAKDVLEAGAFATGTGSGQPIGITKALDGSASEIAPATAETTALVDYIGIVKGVPPRFRGAGASPAFLAHLGTLNNMRALASTAGYEGVMKDPTLGVPGSFQGVPLYEASTMRDYDDLDAAASADNFLAVVGDWRQYVLVDRVGLAVEFIPHLFNTATNYPTGARGWFAHWRHGADSIADGAFQMLSVPTTA